MGFRNTVDPRAEEKLFIEVVHGRRPEVLSDATVGLSVESGDRHSN